VLINHSRPHDACLQPPIATAHGNERVFGKIGELEVRLARNPDDIMRAQLLRQRVFFAQSADGSLDADVFDADCDHLIVADQNRGGEIVGTYRLLRQDRAMAGYGFYSQDEFELNQLVARHPGLRFLELGRSCVLPTYRSKRTIELLWQGIHAYIGLYQIDVMVGCASFSGTTPAAHAHSLSYLINHCAAPWPWDVRAIPGRFCSMDLMPVEAIEPRTALAGLPPLIKAYLRAGARVGQGCVVDHEFGTVDVFIVLPVKQIVKRYLDYYGIDQGAAA
jgi:putative hemolysin